MRFSRPSDRLSPTWTLATGTAQTGYDVGNLNTTLATIDPSLPCWITGTQIRVTADLGSAFEVTAVALVNHTFDAGLQVLFQMNSSNSFGSPPVSEAFTVPTHYENGYACNAFVDLEAAIPVAGNRTYRWISVANPSQANSAEVAIGEIWVCGSGGWRRLTPYDIRHEYTIRNGHLVVSHRSVKGVHTRYDVGARDNRSWAVAVGTDQTGLEQLLEWEDDARHPAYPSLVSLDEASSNQRDAEPRIVIVTEALESRSLHHGVFYTVEFALQELGFGEPIPV